MSLRWCPSILHPMYSWPRPMTKPISTTAPPTPRITGPLMRRFWGKVHSLLANFSEWYCSLFGVRCMSPIFPLPFGLILKWSNRTSLGEAVATQMVRAAGMPAPKILCYGEHDDDFAPFSMLMTRLPGTEWYNLGRQPFNEEDEQPWFGQLSECVNAMRQWESPFPEGTICSAAGTQIKCIRVENHAMGPFDSERAFLEYIIEPPCNIGFESDEEFEQTVIEARKLYDMKHRITFTHGDFKPHNLLINDDGSLAGFIDWESAGWCPEYWDFCTAMLWGKGSWWYKAMEVMSKNQYAAEHESDRAVRSLTVDRWIGLV